MALLELLIAIFQSYSPLISFFGAFIAGGETVLILGILSAQKIFSPWTVFVFCSLGIFTADLMWFYVGKIKHLTHLKKIKFVHHTYHRVDNLIKQSKSPLPSLIIAKLTYGVGIPLMMYWGRRNLKLSKFLYYNALIILIWSSVLVFVGWLIGRGFNKIYVVYENIQLAVLILVITMVLVHIISYLLSKNISKRYTED